MTSGTQQILDDLAAANLVRQGQDYLILYILQDIKVLWDKEGFGTGTDANVSDALYTRLNAAIRLLQQRVKETT